MTNDAQVATLLGSYVIARGSPVVDAGGRRTHIHEASVEVAPEFVERSRLHEVVSLDEILASAPGPDPDGGIELTDDEFDDFWAALHT